jgi:hypothetical protein
MVWLYIARLSNWGGGGVISLFKIFLPAFPRVERGGGSAPCGFSPLAGGKYGRESSPRWLNSPFAARSSVWIFQFRVRRFPAKIRDVKKRDCLAESLSKKICFQFKGWLFTVQRAQ